MKKSLIVGFCLSGIVVSAAQAVAPCLEAGVAIYDGGAPLVVAGKSNPFVVDWNGDGKKDLLVGQTPSNDGNGGKVRLYLNQGTATNPAFSGFSYLQAAGADIVLPHGTGG